MRKVARASLPSGLEQETKRGGWRGIFFTTRFIERQEIIRGRGVEIHWGEQGKWKIKSKLMKKLDLLSFVNNL